jgi:site-specific DNA-methyltransferase (adenine-specific)
MNFLRASGRRHSSEVDWKKPEESLHLVRISDAVEVLRELPDGCVQLAVIDPPYNLELARWDRFGNYIGWAREWLDELPRVLSERGSAVIFGGFQYREGRGGDLLEIMHHLRHKSSLRHVNTVVWNYSTGMGAHRFFSNRHEELVWYARTEGYYFDLDAVRERFDAPTLKRYSRDRRLNPESLLKGKNPGNVWRLERLNANSRERVGHPTQKPGAVVSRIVRALSYPGSLVLDPFAGSGVTAHVCIEEGRHSISVDNDRSLDRYLTAHLRTGASPLGAHRIIRGESAARFIARLDRTCR